ncbi:MAG: hypothetical protein JO056_08905 [Alphaproteobacteria bacterium]|nr:hypothetical protein [Alphaproteobacteria bacterium]
MLNVGELQSMLASSDVAVKTGRLAKDIAIDHPLTWSSTSRLTLDAQQSVTINKPVTVMGQGALTIVTNDNGNPRNKSGEFIVVPERGSVQFWDKKSSLVIDGQKYKLVYTIKSLAAAIAANPSGFYALAKPYDASKDGTYAASPISTEFAGTVDGLGNAISKLSIRTTGNSLYGLFFFVTTDGTIRHLGVLDADMHATQALSLGLLAGGNLGTISRCHTAGRAKGAVGNLGGLLGGNGGSVRYSYADVRLSGRATFEGGLVGYNNRGSIASSYALGPVALRDSDFSNVGGLVGDNEGTISNSFARSGVKIGIAGDGSYFGGLVGRNETVSNITASYAAGEITPSSTSGGLVGYDNADAGRISAAYWDLDMGVSDASQGAANKKDDPGIEGLTTKQLQAELPHGFDSKNWGIKPKVNGGFPYLLAIPPK